MKILTLDIETAPSLAYVWSLWKETVPIDRVVASSEMLCWAAKWRGEKTMKFADRRDPEMVKQIYALVDEADAVVHYNGNSFDMPVLNKEFILADLPPPAPYKNIDLYRVVAKKFKFPSNKLAFVAPALGVGEKQKHAGFDTWIGCMNDDPKQWALMKKYNKQDVTVTEALLDKLWPWIDGMPNHQLYSDGAFCPRCGQDYYALQRQGYAYTAAGKFQRYRCTVCNGWSRSSSRVAGVEAQVAL